MPTEPVDPAPPHSAVPEDRAIESTGDPNATKPKRGEANLAKAGEPKAGNPNADEPKAGNPNQDLDMRGEKPDQAEKELRDFSFRYLNGTASGDSQTEEKSQNAYNPDGTATNTYHSETRYSNGDTLTSDLTRQIDAFGRITSVKGTLASSSGETIVVEQSHVHKPNGTVTISDRSTTRHANPQAVTFRVDLTKELDAFGRTVNVKGAILDSAKNQLDLNLVYAHQPDGTVKVTEN